MNNQVKCELLKARLTELEAEMAKYLEALGYGA